MSDRLKRYLKQKAVLDRATGKYDEYGKPERETFEIACRKEKTIRLVKDSYGKETVSDTTYYTTEKVSAGDLLDGRPVISVSDMTGFSGGVMGWETTV